MREGKIYQISFLWSDGVYIGSTIRSSNQRRLEHLFLLRRNKHHSKHLQYAYNKYGEDSFVFSVIEYVEANFMLAREQFHIWRNEKHSMNSVPVADSTLCATIANRGRKQSDEERAMRSNAQLLALKNGTRKRRVWTDDERVAHGVRLTGRKMPPTKESTRINISLALKGRECPPTAIANSVAKRTSFIKDEVGSWLKMRNGGMSYRQIEKVTGRSRDVIARECKRVN